MSDYFTTDELAEFLRIKPRKVYDLISKGDIPHSRVMGKLLFHKKEISNWISGTKINISDVKDMPNVLLGSHDPLLELAVKHSKSGIAMSFDGSIQGIERFRLNQGIASGLHIYDHNLKSWNVPLIKNQLNMKQVVLMEWAKRQRGLIFKQINNNNKKSFKDFKGKILVRRQLGSGADNYLQYLLKNEDLTYDNFYNSDIAYSENDAVSLILSDHADVSFGLESEAKKFQLKFIPIVIERFDLVVYRQSWFEKSFQALLNFCRTKEFLKLASNFQGYNIYNLGKIHFNSE
jgi:putative molybdopterin biosynthesis protein